MTATKGVVDARVHVLRTLELNGQLDPAIARILDESEDGWRADKAVDRWFETAAAVREFVDRTGLAPEIDDDGAAGLRPWLDSQDPVSLNLVQRNELNSLPGWRSTIDSVEAGPAWRLFVALIEQGTRPPRPYGTEAAVWLAAEYRRSHPDTVIVPVPIGGDAAATILDYVLFRARNIREPGRGDAGHRWAHTLYWKNASAELVNALSVLNVDTGGGQGTAWLASAHRCAEWARKNGRRPRTSGKTREERYCAGWLRRQRARVKAGALTGDGARRLAELDGRG